MRLARDERQIEKGRDSASQKEAIAIRHNDFKRILVGRMVRFLRNLCM